MIARPCQPRDIAAVKAQPEQQAEHAIMIGQAPLLADSFALSFWDADRCLGCIGVAPMTLGSGHAWAILSEAAGPHMLAITRYARDLLDIVPYRRVQTTALCGFQPANRWLVRFLGFSVEAFVMRCYDIDGRDHALYARVRT